MEVPEPTNLQFLRKLVTILTATMILGMVAIFTLLVIRLQPTSNIFPNVVALPETTNILSISRTPNELIVTTNDKFIYILSIDGTKILQTLKMK